MFAIWLPSLEQIKFKGEKQTFRGNLRQERKRAGSNREDKTCEVD